MRNFTQNTFPKQWVILSDKEEYEPILVNYINKEFRQDLSKGLGALGGWYYFNEKVKHPIMDDLGYYIPADKPIPEGFELITFEEFEKYVLNEQFSNTPEDHSSLINLLKEINN